MLDDFNDLTEIIEADDQRFNEIWDEGISVPKEGTPEEAVMSAPQPISILSNISKPQSEELVKDDPGEESEPGPITVTNPAKVVLKNIVKPRHENALGDGFVRESGPTIMTNALKPIVPKNTKPKRDKVSISMVHADNQSVISTISKSTFHSNSDTLDMMSVLMDTPVQRQISEITPIFDISPANISKTRSSENSISSRGGFFSLYKPINGYKTLKMLSCASESSVLGRQAQVIPLLLEHGGTQEESDGIQIDSSQADLDTSKPLPPPVAEEDTNDDARHDCIPSQSTLQSGDFHTESEPIARIQGFLASAASKFVSSSLNVDDDISVDSIYFEEDDDDDNDNNVEKLVKTHSNDILSKVDLPNVTLDEKRLDKRNLLDSLSVAQSQGLVRDRTGDSADEENITTGLGLILPPISQHMPRRFEEEEPNDITLETIEVDEGGKIVIDETDESSTSIESHHQEASSSIPDVYISYRINPDNSYDTVSLSNTSNTSVNTPKANLASKQKSSKIRRWGKKMKIFSGNKHKSSNLSWKAMCDSPGGATVSTATTAMSQSTLYYGEYPVTRKSMPYLMPSKATV